jgi:hypothetical protein
MYFARRNEVFGRLVFSRWPWPPIETCNTHQESNRLMRMTSPALAFNMLTR